MRWHDYGVRHWHLDDLESPAHRILFDDDEDMIPEDARVKKPDADKSNEQ